MITPISSKNPSLNMKNLIDVSARRYDCLIEQVNSCAHPYDFEDQRSFTKNVTSLGASKPWGRHLQKSKRQTSTSMEFRSTIKIERPLGSYKASSYSVHIENNLPPGKSIVRKKQAFQKMSRHGPSKLSSVTDALDAASAQQYINHTFEHNEKNHVQARDETPTDTLLENRQEVQNEGELRPKYLKRNAVSDLQDPSLPEDTSTKHYLVSKRRKVLQRLGIDGKGSLSVGDQRFLYISLSQACCF